MLDKINLDEWMKIQNKSLSIEMAELVRETWRIAQHEQRLRCADAVMRCEDAGVKTRVRRHEAMGACIIATEGDNDQD